MDIGAVIVGLVSALFGGGIASLIMVFIARRKAPSEIAINEAEAVRKEAEAAEIINRASKEAIDWMKGRLTDLRGEISTLQKDNSELRVEVCGLQKENSELRRVQEKQQDEIIELQEMFDVVLAGAHVLHDQVVEMNGKPKYTPPERRKR